jgi:hypothetical protein
MRVALSDEVECGRADGGRAEMLRSGYRTGWRGTTKRRIRDLDSRFDRRRNLGNDNTIC